MMRNEKSNMRTTESTRRSNNGQTIISVLATLAIVFGAYLSAAGDCYKTVPGERCAPAPTDSKPWVNGVGFVCQHDSWGDWNATHELYVANALYGECGMTVWNPSCVNPTHTVMRGTWNSVTDDCASWTTFSITTDFSIYCTVTTLGGEECPGSPP